MLELVASTRKSCYVQSPKNDQDDDSLDLLKDDNQPIKWKVNKAYSIKKQRRPHSFHAGQKMTAVPTDPIDDNCRPEPADDVIDGQTESRVKPDIIIERARPSSIAQQLTSKVLHSLNCTNVDYLYNNVGSPFFAGQPPPYASSPSSAMMRRKFHPQQQQQQQQRRLKYKKSSRRGFESVSDTWRFQPFKRY